MKNVILLFLFAPFLLFSQKRVLEQVSFEKIKNTLFISIEEANSGLSIEYAVDKKEFVPINEGRNFSHRDPIGIYTSWYNPLRYALEIDSKELEDNTEEIVTSFFESLGGQFNISPPLDQNVSEKIASQKSDGLVEANFSDLNLLTWYLDVVQIYNAGDSTIQEEMVGPVEKLVTFLNEVEKYSKVDFKAKSKKVFEHFHKVKSYDEILNDAGEYKLGRTELEDIGRSRNKLKDVNDDLNNNFIGIIEPWAGNSKEIQLKVLRAVTEGIIKNYISSKNDELATIDGYISHLEDLDDKLRKVSSKTKKKEDLTYYRIKSYEAKANIINELNVKINKLEYDMNDLSIKDGSEVFTSKLNFHWHRKFIPVAGVGVYFSTVDVISFQAGADDNGNVVVEQVSSNDEPVYSSMLNFYLNAKIIDGVFPLIQFGADPTKERPFLLAGAGIGVPKSNFSISGGLVWTWLQSLKTLKVGDMAESAAQIKEDIEFSFRSTPAFYLGLQYSF